MRASTTRTSSATSCRPAACGGRHRLLDAGEGLAVPTPVGQRLDLGGEQPGTDLRVVVVGAVEQAEPLLGRRERVEGALGDARGGGQGGEQLGAPGRVGPGARRASRSSSSSSALRARPTAVAAAAARSVTLSTSGSVSGIRARAFLKCRKASSGPAIRSAESPA